MTAQSHPFFHMTDPNANPPSHLVLPADFPPLLATLRGIITEARQKVLRAADTAQVQTCWEIGRHIVEFEQGGEARAAYGKRLLADLAEASVSYSINFPHPLIGKQSFCVRLTNGSYLSQIAPARTFGFLHEADAMRQQGLIRGASTGNAIVLNREEVLNPPLRFADEFVRHKVLDLIGDLALIGKRILGSVVADRAGHAMHTALVSRILRDRSYWEETALEEEPAAPVFASAASLSV